MVLAIKSTCGANRASGTGTGGGTLGVGVAVPDGIKAIRSLPLPHENEPDDFQSRASMWSERAGELALESWRAPTGRKGRREEGGMLGTLW